MYMETIYIVMICWLSIVAIVYVALWFDTIYYRHNLPQGYRKILDIFTEEE